MSKMINKTPLADNEYLVPVTWQMCGYIVVKADSPQEAHNKVKNDVEDYSLPCDSTYVEGSFTTSFDDSDGPEAIQDYTDSFNKGQMNVLIDRDYKSVTQIYTRREN